MTRGELYNYVKEAEGWIESKSLIAIIHAVWIKNFMLIHAKDIEIIEKEIAELRKVWFEFDAEGKIKMYKGVDGNVPILLPEKTLEMWNKTCDDYMNQPVPERLKLVTKDGKTLVN